VSLEASYLNFGESALQASRHAAEGLIGIALEGNTAAIVEVS